MKGSDRDARAGDWAAIGLPTALAALLCLIGITGRSLGFDEAATATIAAQHGSALGSDIAHDGGNMSGYYLLIHVLISALRNGEFVLRLPSALASIATVALTGATALRLFDRRAAFAAGLLAAVSLPLVFWAQNARGYALMVALVAAAFLMLVSLAARRDEPEAPNTEPDARTAGSSVPWGRVSRWIAYVAFMTLATYSSFVAVLVLPAQVLMLLPRGRRACLRPFAVAVAAIAVLCIPLLVLALHRGAGQLFWVPRPTHEIEVQVLESLTSAGLEPSFHRTATTTPLLIGTLALSIAIAVWSVRGWRRGEPVWGAGVALAWLIVPVAITFFYSLVAQPLFQPRNVLMSVPAVALLLGAGIGHPRVPRLVAPALLTALIALRALQLAPSYGVSPEPWQQATASVLSRARPGDCIAFYPLDGRMAFQYYIGTSGSTDARAPRSILPIARWGSVRTYVERYVTLSTAQIASRGAGCLRLWFVSSHEGQLDGPARSLANRARFLVLRVRMERNFGHGKVKQFGYAAAVHVQLLSPRGG